MAFGGVIAGYLPYTVVVRPGSLPASGLVARVYAPLTDAALAAIGFVLLLTPTGSPPSPRWRRLAWVSGSRWPVAPGGGRRSPPGRWTRAALAIDGPVGPRAYGGALQVANQLALVVAILVILGGGRVAGDAVPARPRGRAPAAALGRPGRRPDRGGHAGHRRSWSRWATWPWPAGRAWLGTVFLPLAAGAAILRYRLYDLDRIISRTLAYGLLTVLLGGAYAAVVLGLGQLLGRDSSLVVAAATLAVAALFQPARRRVQAAVDRRFNRRRHDAARIIEGFGARLRDQVDLDTLTAEVLAVADQTMQPTRASLWLRPPAAPAGR